MTKVAIIGCGRMGRRHITAVQNLNFDVMGVIDPFQESLDIAIAENNIPINNTFKSFDELLEVGTPELVIIATTADSHHTYVLQAAHAGVKNILCEKPMATSIQHCKEMIDVCEKNNVRLAINHPVRFTEADVEMKSLLSSEQYGGLKAVHISAGNFGLAMNASHNIEMFRFLTGEAPTTIQAWLDADTIPNPRGEQFCDRSGCLRISTPSGKALNISAYAENGHGIFITYAARNGQIVLNPLTGDMTSSVRNKDQQDKPTTQYGLPCQNEQSKITSSDLIVRCQNVILSLLNDENYPDGKEVIRTIELLAAAYASHENNHAIIDVTKDKLDLERVFPWA